MKGALLARQLRPWVVYDDEDAAGSSTGTGTTGKGHPDVTMDEARAAVAAALPGAAVRVAAVATRGTPVKHVFSHVTHTVRVAVVLLAPPAGTADATSWRQAVVTKTCSGDSATWGTRDEFRRAGMTTWTTKVVAAALP